MEELKIWKHPILIRHEYLNKNEVQETPEPEIKKISYGMPLDGQQQAKEPATPKTKVKNPQKERANVVKLTDEDDRKIRELLASGITNRREIARQIGREKQYETVVRRINKIKKESSGVGA